MSTVGETAKAVKDHFRISFRVSLIVAIPLLVVITGGGIALRTYFATKAEVEKLANDVFTGVASQTVAEAKSELQRAVPIVELALLQVRDHLLAADSDSLARQFTEILHANPEFSWVSYSQIDGSFTGAHHKADGGFVVNQSTIHDGRTELYEHAIADDGTWTLNRHVDDTKYDPRKRPFYTLAVQAGRRTWTPPYVFYEEGVPGLSCASPYRDATGNLVGVFSVDYDLNGLSSFVAGLHLSDHGSVFIFTPDGTLVAHPTVHVVEKVGQAGAGKLLTVGDVTDPLVQGFFASPDEKAVAATAVAAGQDGTWQFTFTSGGTRYLASYTLFQIDNGLRWVVGAVAPADDFMGSVQRNNRTSLLISAVALILSFFLAVVLSSRIAGPLTQLADDMDEVGRFHLANRTSEKSIFHEIHHMHLALQRMKGGLRSFAAYVPRDLVRFMLASGQEAKLEGATKELTIFFSDIAGFTSISEGLKPDELVQLLGGYLDEMTKIIIEHRGQVDKYIGDGIMVFWGAPDEDADHAVHACEAALLCQRRLHTLGDGGALWAKTLYTRMGLATGEVLVGNIGSTERMNYTVMGDIANLASRLEGLNKQYGTNLMVSESTYRAARERVIARPIDVTAVKGKHVGVRVYELLCLVTDHDPTARELARLCSEGLDAYLARDFETAITAYNEVLGLKPGDLPAKIMLERCQGYRSLPPPAEWTGVHVATSK